MSWFNNDEDDGDEFGAVPEAWTDEAGNLHHPDCEGWHFLTDEGLIAEHQDQIATDAPCDGCY